FIFFREFYGKKTTCTNLNKKSLFIEFNLVKVVAGRNVVLFVIFGCLEEMQSRSIVFFVFYAWSSMEIFRYPFYMLAYIDTEWQLLTWLRYNLWIPLYPLAVLAEAVAVIQSLPIFDDTRLFSLPLPGFRGRSLSFSYTLQVYLVLIPTPSQLYSKQTPAGLVKKHERKSH
uniref:Very-long-chain (3R)-3-hydroxyacyl-CoA dehydratase n=1 Tax=Oryzias sinensis TaxID=183150 RepID=A0A8C7YEE4_9TELE